MIKVVLSSVILHNEVSETLVHGTGLSLSFSFLSRLPPNPSLLQSPPHTHSHHYHLRFIPPTSCYGVPPFRLLLPSIPTTPSLILP